MVSASDSTAATSSLNPSPTLRKLIALPIVGDNLPSPSATDQHLYPHLCSSGTNSIRAETKTKKKKRTSFLLLAGPLNFVSWGGKCNCNPASSSCMQSIRASSRTIRGQSLPCVLFLPLPCVRSGTLLFPAQGTSCAARTFQGPCLDRGWRWCRWDSTDETLSSCARTSYCFSTMACSMQ